MSFDVEHFGLTIELCREVDDDGNHDGRWVANVIGCPGVIVYGNSRDEAKWLAVRLAANVALSNRP